MLNHLFLAAPTSGKSTLANDARFRSWDTDDFWVDTAFAELKNMTVTTSDRDADWHELSTKIHRQLGHLYPGYGALPFTDGRSVEALTRYAAIKWMLSQQNTTHPGRTSAYFTNFTGPDARSWIHLLTTSDQVRKGLVLDPPDTSGFRQGHGYKVVTPTADEIFNRWVKRGSKAWMTRSIALSWVVGIHQGAADPIHPARVIDLGPGEYLSEEHGNVDIDTSLDLLGTEENQFENLSNGSSHLDIKQIADDALQAAGYPSALRTHPNGLMVVGTAGVLGDTSSATDLDVMLPASYMAVLPRKFLATLKAPRDGYTPGMFLVKRLPTKLDVPASYIIVPDDVFAHTAAAYQLAAARCSRDPELAARFKDRLPSKLARYAAHDIPLNSARTEHWASARRCTVIRLASNL